MSSTKKNIHVIPHGEDWAVKSASSQRASRVLDTQKEAIDVAREQAKRNNSELLIHGRNGKIREKNSYGNDNFPPKG